jgi:hypothetical protein
MIARIRAAWNQNQGASGTSLIRFTIKRDGIDHDATIFKQRHGDARHRGAARGARDPTLPPLPDAYPNPTLTMRLSFQYQ